MTEATTRCPCGRGPSYADCCGPVHGGTPAPTAERVMRARYSAYALGNVDYLAASWHPDTRPPLLGIEATERWYRLDVVATTGGGLLDTTGTVEFRAHYREGRRDAELHEVSRFERVDGAWVYVEPADAALLTDDT